ncbi:MAG: penicillin-binding protein [Ruminococcus sp.]|nr:penicillin-binding protein [Ruminococcus sp.]
MKRTLRRSMMVMVVAVLIVGGVGYLSYRVVTEHNTWINMSYNNHISSDGGLTRAGTITDRNGVVLAKSTNGERVYNENESIRRGLLHVVGDDTVNIGTSMQSLYRMNLTGYSFVWGLGLPTSLKGNCDMKLTVDADVCSTVYDSFDGRKGACIVYNYETGEILCDVSTPSYDPNAPPEINEENQESYEGVYVDNVVGSSYTPGSVFKLVTTAAALKYIDDIETKEWYCEGVKKIGGDDETSNVHCNDGEAHGYETLSDALGNSCNIVFAEIAEELGPEKMTEVAEEMGINANFSVGDITVKKGHYDVSKATPNQLAWSGVGQYTDLVNPMQMAIICSAIANDGKPVLPYLIDSDTSLLTKVGITTGGGKGSQMMEASVAQTIAKMMRNNVTNFYGEGSFPSGLEVAAKTGTGEITLSNDDGKSNKNNAWIVGYCQNDDFPLAFAVVVTDVDGYGSTYAQPIASTALQACMSSIQK